MKTSIAITLTIGIIITPLIATIIFGILIFNEIKITSIISIPIFCIILLLHIFIIYITYRKYNRSSEFTCRISAPYYDFFLLILQIGFIIFGILLAIVNMQNSNGKCSAFVSSSSVVSADNGNGGSDDDDNDNVIVKYFDGTSTTTVAGLPPENPDDMDSGSASCGGVTAVFLIACIILCLKLFTLPILKNLTSLTKQIRSSTMHPLTADPRIRVNAFSMHETFNAPTTASAVPRLPSATFCAPSTPRTPIPSSSSGTPRIILLQRSQTNCNAANRPSPTSLSPPPPTTPISPQNNNNSEEGHAYFLSIPPPPSYAESLEALPPSYENISNLA